MTIGARLYRVEQQVRGASAFFGGPRGFFLKRKTILLLLSRLSFIRDVRNNEMIYALCLIFSIIIIIIIISEK